ncbi:hypothetical protein ANN_21556 [Periplaneta americana]|uniref:Reverse transcriptase domain-containing protein n=1 Tax=Periplaneta americana TaxID=6978 RepID=A0ABQ8S5S6_PERAM|nr:hypothetical protein ANN_21556 [Periplaneta americana]
MKIFNETENNYVLREEQHLRVFENKVLRKIFGAKRDEVTGEWRKLHNTELHALYSSPDIIRNIKSRRLRWAGHVARMGESRNAYRVAETVDNSIATQDSLNVGFGISQPAGRRFFALHVSAILEKKWEYKGTVHQIFIDFKKAHDSVKREVLYDILIEFGIPKKLVRLIKTCLGCETWTITLREEQRFRVFENKVLRKILGAKRDEVTGEWRKLHNTELHALYSSPDIIRNIKSRRLSWAGHVARMGESRNAYRLLVGRPEGKKTFREAEM